MRVVVRKGDIAILAGAIAIAVYEKRIEDDEDLISRRVLAYKTSHPVLTCSIVLLTTAHLLNVLPEHLDVYHHLMRVFRSPPTPPQPSR